MKEEQMEIADVLLEMGVDFDVIEKITSVSALDYCIQIAKKRKNEKHV